jgi:hypothetical protein
MGFDTARLIDGSDYIDFFPQTQSLISTASGLKARAGEKSWRALLLAKYAHLAR